MKTQKKIDLRERLTPAFCPHCHKILSTPPQWLKIYEALSGKYGMNGLFTQIDVRVWLHLKNRQRAEQIVRYCLSNGYIQKFRPVGHTGVYRRAPCGSALYHTWKVAMKGNGKL